MKIENLLLSTLKESPENKLLYKPITEDDPATIKTAEGIRQEGVLVPFVVTADRYVVSGHRRYVAAGMAGLESVPCEMLKFRRGDSPEHNEKLLRLIKLYNDQRVKNREEVLREILVDIDERQAVEQLVARRARKRRIKMEEMEIRPGIARSEISKAKFPLLHAIQRVIHELWEFLPLTVRLIFYQLLNDPPLIHASKPDSFFGNNKASYRALAELVTRARYEGDIDFEDIHDPTRPTIEWARHANVQSFYDQELDEFLVDYPRDLMQTQPDHIEIVFEKNTLENIVTPVAAEFGIRLTPGRGQCTTRPIYDIAKRYKDSGKEGLKLILMSDLDPDGDAIAHSIPQRLRDDHNIENIKAYRCALTMEQVEKLNLPESYLRAKKDSPNYKRYVETYDTDLVYELEAVPPKTSQQMLRDAIEAVIDRKEYNAEVAQQEKDLRHIAVKRSRLLRLWKELELQEE
jgi:hypothetical protein